MKKMCPKCEKEKDKKEFVKDLTRKDNLSYWCKKCTYDYNKKRKEQIKQEREMYF